MSLSALPYFFCRKISLQVKNPMTGFLYSEKDNQGSQFMLLSLAFWPGRTIFTQHKCLLQWRQVADPSMKEVYQVIKLLRWAGCFLLDLLLKGQRWICSGQAVAIFRLALENRASKSWARHNLLSGGHGSFVHVHPFISPMWLSTKSLATLL